MLAVTAAVAVAVTEAVTVSLGTPCVASGMPSGEGGVWGSGRVTVV